MDSIHCIIVNGDDGDNDGNVPIDEERGINPGD